MFVVVFIFLSLLIFQLYQDFKWGKIMQYNNELIVTVLVEEQQDNVTLDVLLNKPFIGEKNYFVFYSNDLNELYFHTSFLMNSNVVLSKERSKMGELVFEVIGDERHFSFQMRKTHEDVRIPLIMARSERKWDLNFRDLGASGITKPYEKK